MSKDKELVWQSVAWPGVEVLRLTTDQAMAAHGTVIGKSDTSTPFAIDYLVTLTTDWQVESVHIRSLIDDRSS